MYYVPSIFGDSFNDFRRVPNSSEWSKSLLKTDVQEVGDNYVLSIDLPGVKKEDMKIHLKEGYLTIEATRSSEKETKDENEKYLRRERFLGSCKRTFDVGKGLKEEDIKARYADGVLTITFPKEEKRAVEEKKYIAIEG